MFCDFQRRFDPQLILILPIIAVWAVIPVKQISQAKQRLSPLLSTEERRTFFCNA